jgi:hypothetical protein
MQHRWFEQHTDRRHRLICNVLGDSNVCAEVVVCRPQICENTLRRRSTKDSIKFQVAMSFVYFIRRVRGGPGSAVKIGWTGGNPRKRLSQLQIGNESELRLEATIHVPAPSQASLLESQIHDHFASRRGRGEWFDVSSAEVARLVSDVQLSSQTLTGTVYPDHSAVDGTCASVVTTPKPSASSSSSDISASGPVKLPCWCRDCLSPYPTTIDEHGSSYQPGDTLLMLIQRLLLLAFLIWEEAADDLLDEWVSGARPRSPHPQEPCFNRAIPSVNGDMESHLKILCDRICQVAREPMIASSL